MRQSKPKILAIDAALNKRITCSVIDSSTGWKVNMDIGIIGSGNIGSTLARHLTALGHQVAIANSRGPASLAALAAETGATAVTVEQAARAGRGHHRSARDRSEEHTSELQS